MVSNPKKKKQYATKATDAAAAAAATTNDNKDSAGGGGDSQIELVYKYVGTTLLTKPNAPPQPTAEVLKGKDLIGFYFGASWCQYSKEFTPKLLQFYDIAKTHQMEIIYVSSDNTSNEFHEYFETMPWLAMDGSDKTSAMLKHNLATTLSCFKLPTFVVLNIKTGNFVTDLAKQEIINLETATPVAATTTATEGGEQTTSSQDDKDVYATKSAELVESWKTRDPETIGTADGTLDVLARGLAYLLKNPVVLVAFVALFTLTPTIKRMQENPLIAIAFWFIFKKMAQEPLSRNEPYMAQEEAPGPVGVVDDGEGDKDKDSSGQGTKEAKKNK